MPFDPDAFLASSAPTPGSPSAGTFDPDAFLASVPTTPAPTPQVSGLESFGRGALQGVSLGLSDEITGALESLFSDKSYRQARDESRANNAAAEQANPLTYGAGNLAGSIAPSFIPGVAVAKGATALSAAAKAAGVGAVAGLGTSNADLTKGEFGQAAKDVGTAAALSGAIGGILHGVGQKAASQSGESFEKGGNADLFGKARSKDALQAQRVQAANPEIYREVAYSDEFKPVLDLARKGKTEQAIDAADTFIDKAASQRLKNYEVAGADGATGNVGSVVQRLRQEASAASATTGRAEEAKALASMADHIKNSQSVTSSADLPDVLQQLGKLPKTVTKQDLWDTAIKATGSKSAGAVPEDIANAIEATTFAYDPQAPIPLLRLRQITTAAQNASAEALGTIAETERARIAGATTKAVNDALESHLDAAALTSKKAAKAVEQIRHDDKVISMGLSAKEGLTQKLTKENTGKGATLGDRAQEAAAATAKMAGIGLLGHGDPIAGVALHVAPYALKATGAAARKANDTLARLVYAESQGNTYAKTVLSALRQTPQGLARLAALQSSQPGAQ